MFDLFKKIMPREDGFFDMFERHAATIQNGAIALRQVLDGGKEVNALCARVSEEEQKADTIIHDVLQALRKSFITPFDRSDIQGLITAMDDALDQMNKTAKAIQLFEVKKFDPAMRDMGDLIVKSAEATVRAVPMLRAMKANANDMVKLTAAIVEMEEQSDRVQEKGMKQLYLTTGKKDAMAFIVGSEIYEHLEKVSDRFEDVANTLSAILVEHL